MRKHLNGFECQMSRCFSVYCAFTTLRKPPVCSQFLKRTETLHLRPSRTQRRNIFDSSCCDPFFFTARKSNNKTMQQRRVGKRERLQTLGESGGKRKKISFSRGGENTEQPSLLLQLSSSLHQLNMLLDITGGGGGGRGRGTRRWRKRWMRRSWGA